jgi:hypothetical protein
MSALIQQAPADTDSAEKLLNVTRRKRSSRFHPTEPARKAAAQDPSEARALDAADLLTAPLSPDEPADEPVSEHSATIASFFPEFQCDWQAELGEPARSEDIALPIPVTAAFAVSAVAQDQVYLQALRQNPMQAETSHVAESSDMLPAFSIACGSDNGSVACIMSGHASSHSVSIEQLDSEDASLLPVMARRCSTSDPLHVRFGSDLTPMRASIGNVPDSELAGMFPLLVSCHDACAADATLVTFPNLGSSALLTAHSVVPVVTECSISPALVTLTSNASDQVTMLHADAGAAVQIGLRPVLASSEGSLLPSLVSAPVSFQVSAQSDQMVLVKPRVSLAVQPDRSETVSSLGSSSVTPILYSPVASKVVDKLQSDDKDHVTQLLAENRDLKLQVQQLQREALLRAVHSGGAQEVIKFHHASPNGSAKRYLCLSGDGTSLQWSWSQHMWQATVLRLADIESISPEEQPQQISNHEWNVSALALRLSFKTADRSYNFVFADQSECAKWRAVLGMLVQQQAI